MKNLLILASLLFSIPVTGQQSRPSANETIRDRSWTNAIQKARHYADSMRVRQDIPGLSICISTTEKVLWAEGFGYADLENKKHVTIHSKFRIGSVSKSLTSIAFGKLIQDKKLDPDLPIDQYVPFFPAKKYPITARQLATHTAGIRHYRDNDPLNCLIRYTNVQAGLAIFSSDSLLFRPGSASNYSTFGYTLLSAVIENAAKTDYLSLMQKTVLTPLKMFDTGPDYSDSIVTNRVRFYEHQQSRLVNAPQVDNSYKWAGGGFLSTPMDLTKLALELVRSTILDRQTVAMLLTPQLLENGSNTGYAMGWRIGKDKQNRRIVHHGGSSDGGRTFLLLYPDDNVAIAITANMSGVNINLAEAEMMANFFFNARP